MKHIKIALVGQPNVGKSMLTNAIGDTTLHVGNFSGVTVEKKEISFWFKDYKISIVDLPGTYMLTNYSIEEKVTSDFLNNGEYDLILNVADSTNLERNLQLTSELLSLDKKMLIALNMIDEAHKENIEINSNYMTELLGVNVIPVSAVTKEGIERLVHNIVQVYESPKKDTKLIFSEAIEEEILNIVAHLAENKFSSEMSYRKIAINLISEKKETYQMIHDEPIWISLQPILLNAIKHIKTHHDEDAMIDILAEEYMAFNNGILTETVKNAKLDPAKFTVTQKIDNILIHPLFGIPIFLFLMWVLFQLTFEIGSIPMDWIDGFYLLDGFFHKFGLHGQSFIPLVTGFGCSIPAYMSARILKNDTDRLLTLFIIGFMSCGARLPVYVLFVGAFFTPESSGNILFIIYVSGAILGIIMAKILKMTAFKGESEPFVMEMPKYRLPSIVLIWHTVKSKTWMYLKKAGTFIAAASMLVWFLSNYPQNDLLSSEYEKKIEIAMDDTFKNKLANELNQQLLEQSYLGKVGKFIEPVFAPLGMDWKMAVALQTGLAAKEVVVSTLGVLYSLGGDVDEQNSTLMKRLHDNIPFASAVAFIIIMMIYLPCLAATIVFSKEAGGLRYTLYLMIFTTIVAYIFAFIGYHIALVF